MKIYIDGYIVPDEDVMIMEWFEYPYFSPSVLREKLKQAGGENVELMINSYGGDVWAAQSMYAELKQYKGKVTGLITGLAASAATIVMCACKNLKASPGAQVMIHNASTSADGDYRDMEATAEMLKTANDGIKAIYTAKTGRSYDDLQKALDAETWFSAETALEAGFVDEIETFDDVKLVAGLNDLDMKKLRQEYEEQQNKKWQKQAEACLQIEKERY